MSRGQSRPPGGRRPWRSRVPSRRRRRRRPVHGSPWPGEQELRVDLFDLAERRDRLRRRDVEGHRLRAEPPAGGVPRAQQVAHEAARHGPGNERPYDPACARASGSPPAPGDIHRPCRNREPCPPAPAAARRRSGREVAEELPRGADASAPRRMLSSVFFLPLLRALSASSGCRWTGAPVFVAHRVRHAGVVAVGVGQQDRPDIGRAPGRAARSPGSSCGR